MLIWFKMLNIPKGATAVIIVRARATEFGTQVNNETIIYPDGHNQTVNCTIEVQGVDLAVVKSVDKEVHFVNDTVVWTIRLSNARDGATATNIRLNDTLPAEFTYLSSSATSGTFDSNTFVWSIPSMNAGASATLTIVTRATATGNFTNEANVTCDEPEWDYDNNYDNATVTISLLPPPNKTADKNRTLLYENVTYNLTVLVLLMLMCSVTLL